MHTSTGSNNFSGDKMNFILLIFASIFGLLLGALLAFSWTRPKPKDTRIMHRLIVGASRTGKSTAVRSWLREVASENLFSILLQEPHGPLAWEFFADCIRMGFEDRVIFDELSYCQDVPGYQFFRRSEAADRVERRAENDLFARQAIDAIAAEREKSLDTMPILGTVTYNAVSFWQYQDPPVGQSWIPYTIIPGHPKWTHMVEHCTWDDAAWPIKRLEMLRGQSLRNEVGPTERLFERLFKAAAFDVRTRVNPFNMREALEKKMIIIQAGGGPVPDAAIKGVFNTTAINVFHECRAYFNQNNKPLYVYVVKDECNNYAGITPMVSSAMAQSLKTGCSFVPICQSLDFPTPQITDNILQNIEHQEFFRQGSETSADIASRQLATLLLDPKKVKHRDIRERTVAEGYDEERKIIHRKVQDENITYEQLSEQMQMFKKTLMSLQTGERFVRHGTHVSPKPEKVLQCSSSWAFQSVIPGRIQEALQRIRSRPYFQAPQMEEPTRPRRGPASRLSGGNDTDE